jgi:hypothetical protein
LTTDIAALDFLGLRNGDSDRMSDLLLDGVDGVEGGSALDLAVFDGIYSIFVASAISSPTVFRLRKGECDRPRRVL